MFKVTFKEAFNAGYWLSTDGKITPEDLIGYSDEGTPIIHKRQILQAAGLIVACATKIKIDDGEVISVIAVDDFFMTASDNDKKVVIAHEQGHISNGDLEHIRKINTLERVLNSFVGRVQDKEIAADLYAAKTVGFEKTLHELEWLYSNVPGYISKKELMNRIKTLKKLQVA